MLVSAFAPARFATRLLAALALLAGAAAVFPQDPPPPLGLPEETAPVQVSLMFDVRELVPGARFEAILVLDHAPGWHSYGEDSGEAGLPTSIAWELPEGLTAGKISWPRSRTFVDRGISTRGYSGRTELKIPMAVSRGFPSRDPAHIEARVSYLACMESCVPGEASFSFDLPVGTASGFSIARLLLAVLGAFAGGLILNIMPCVLPVLSLKIHGLMSDATGSSASSGGTLARGLAYGAGVIASFWALAAFILALKAGGGLVGWGFQFQDPGFVAAMSVFFTALALSMLGVFEIGAPSGATAVSGRKGLAAAFLSGALATAAATPCTAPFMGAAVGYALGAGPFETIAVLSALGAGLALPIVFLSAFPRFLPRLPKSGRWMESLQRILGFVLLGTVVWLLSVQSALSGPGVLIPQLASLLGVGAAAWVWGRWGGPAMARGVRIAARVTAILVFSACLSYSVATAAARGEDSVASAVTLSPNEEEGGIPWLPYGEGLLAELRASGKPVFIDFRADWCLSCVANEKAALGSGRVASEFARLGIAALKADWTRSNPQITRALESYGRRGVPLYVLYLPGKGTPVILPEILSQGALLKALEPLEELP